MRVLMANFGTIVRLGLQEFAEQEGLEVVADSETKTSVARLNDVRPDVVLLDLDDDRALALAWRIANDFPAIKVIACSSKDPVMMVFPPFHHGESYVSELSLAHLAYALKN
jgi:DNA-binding NarL/FixJ family response regulator